MCPLVLRARATATPHTFGKTSLAAAPDTRWGIADTRRLFVRGDRGDSCGVFMQVYEESGKGRLVSGCMYQVVGDQFNRD